MSTAVRRDSYKLRLLAAAIAASRTLPIPLIIGVSLAGLYLATLTSDYFWDGITFALQIEKVARGERAIRLLFHQNHLLYDLFGYALYWPARAIGPGVRALTVLQLANVALGSWAV